jgi:hypothetical protein
MTWPFSKQLQTVPPGSACAGTAGAASSPAITKAMSARPLIGGADDLVVDGG